MSTMRQDNEKRKGLEAKDLDNALRYKAAQPQEQQVVRLAVTVANMICERVAEIHMMNVPLPLGYVVRFMQLEGSSLPKNVLYKVFETPVGSTEIAVNEANPIVELCLRYCQDVKAGFIPKLEEAYRARLKEFAEAEVYMSSVVNKGLGEYQTTDNGSGESNMVASRWEGLEN